MARLIHMMFERLFNVHIMVGWVSHLVWAVVISARANENC